MAYKKIEKVKVETMLTIKMNEFLENRAEDMGISKAELLRSIVTEWMAKTL